MMNLSEIFAYATGIGGVFSALAMGLYSFRNNASGIKNDIISTYETRLAQMDKDIRDLKTSLDEMKTKFDVSEKNREHAYEILQGRNPELDKYMDLTLKMLTDIHGAVMPQIVSK